MSGFDQKKHAGKPHMSLVICGHVDAGKSTTTGRLIFDLDGIPAREIEKLKAEAAALGKSSFYFAFYMDTSKEERKRGVTIACTTKEFFTDSYHYTIIDAPGHRDFIKNMITGASQADVALLMVPADGNFAAAIKRGNHKAGEVQGQTRQHARLINLLGVKQLIVGVNKMDCDVAGYTEARYNEIRDEMKDMLSKVGWKDYIQFNAVPILPISGWVGDNVCKHSAKMPWWKGQDINVFKKQKVSKKTFEKKKFDVLKVFTLVDCLEKMVKLPSRDDSKPVRVPVSGVYKIKGVGDVITGRVEQGVIKPETKVIFLPTHTASKQCGGKVFTVEMHHQNMKDGARAGDNVGMNVKGLSKENMPRVGDIMVEEKESELKACHTFRTQVSVLDHPGQLKPGYTPIAFVRTGRAAVKMTTIYWKVGKSTGGAQVENPPFLKANEMGEVEFEPQQPFVVDTFKNCEGLGRVAIMEGNGVVMLGTVKGVTFKDADKK